MAAVTCERCGLSALDVRGPGGAVSQGWSKFEAIGEDGDTVSWATVCPECLTEAEEAGVWPTCSAAKER
jgi:hypothetical protein